MPLSDAEWYDALGRSESVYMSPESGWYMIEYWQEASNPECEPELKNWAYFRNFGQLVRVTKMPAGFDPRKL